MNKPRIGPSRVMYGIELPNFKSILKPIGTQATINSAIPEAMVRGFMLFRIRKEFGLGLSPLRFSQEKLSVHLLSLRCSGYRGACRCA